MCASYSHDDLITEEGSQIELQLISSKVCEPKKLMQSESNFEYIILKIVYLPFT